jgi:hypothetical protein
MAKTHVQIIDSLGASAMAAKLSLKPATVRMWKFRKRIPRTAWPELIEVFPDLSVEVLKAAEAA